MALAISAGICESWNLKVPSSGLAIIPPLDRESLSMEKLAAACSNVSLFWSM